ncbi:hypothetical protein IIA95_01800 [Patescibacteria group bacterium]|nr:hypothetical protein [Patescibacteria group bacterium]
MRSQGFIVHTIILPTAPQPDTLVAIFLLKKFGERVFPGIKEARVKIWQTLPAEKSAEILEKEGHLLIDIGMGCFDHHGKKDATASGLVAFFLGVSDDPALAKMLEYARRDDLFGKGTVSADPIDRAFGLSALVYHLNRSLSQDASRTVGLVLPFLIAHYNEERKRAHELPREFASLKDAGKATSFVLRHGNKNVKAIVVESDNISLAGYLRSREGGRIDVVGQYLSSGHANILTRPAKRIDLRNTVSLIRIREAELQKRDIDLSLEESAKPGRLKKIPEWYYDRATNSIQNGGVNPRSVPPTRIPKPEMVKILALGLTHTLR